MNGGNQQDKRNNRNRRTKGALQLDLRDARSVANNLVRNNSTFTSTFHCTALTEIPKPAAATPTTKYKKMCQSNRIPGYTTPDTPFKQSTSGKIDLQLRTVDERVDFLPSLHQVVNV